MVGVGNADKSFLSRALEGENRVYIDSWTRLGSNAPSYVNESSTITPTSFEQVFKTEIEGVAHSVQPKERVWTLGVTERVSETVRTRQLEEELNQILKAAGMPTSTVHPFANFVCGKSDLPKGLDYMVIFARFIGGIRNYLDLSSHFRNIGNQPYNPKVEAAIKSMISLFKEDSVLCNELDFTTEEYVAPQPKR